MAAQAARRTFFFGWSIAYARRLSNQSITSPAGQRGWAFVSNLMRFGNVCNPPSIYHGHYRELFNTYRILKKADMAGGDSRAAATRLLEMVHLETETIVEMLQYWSEVNGRSLPLDHFDSHRKLECVFQPIVDAVSD